MTPAHDVIDLGDGRYRIDVPDIGLSYHVERLRRRNDELVAELIVTCDLAGARRISDEGIISAADFNLTSLRARADRAAHLARRAQLPADQFDWHASLEFVCLRVLQAERAGAPAVLLRELDPPAADETLFVEGRPILTRHPMIDFGDGGSCKSYLALWTAGQLARRGRSVGYFDWEFDGAEHRGRLQALFGDAMPGLYYARCEAPLVHEADRLRRLVLAHGLDYIVVDSVAVACAGKPEDAEHANEFFRALRQLRVGSLLIAHVRQENGDQKPFGSSFWHNNARATWYVKRSEADADPARVSVALFHRKANTGPLRPAIGYALTFGADRVEVRLTDPAAHQDFAGAVPLWQRLRSALRAGPLTLDALADETEAKRESVKKAVLRSPRLFTRLGDGRIALVERIG